MTRPDSLQGWLDHIERQHSKTIALGLDRVARVRDRMGLSPRFPVITVGGTNGKGSTCAMLEAILDCAGYVVGCYASPHLLRYNERVRIGRTQARDAELCQAFATVEQARGDVPLTYFEFGTLAAVWLLCERGVEVGVLEVGLGGRLDAVNAFEPACAVVCTVALDHVDYLGATLEQIGREKAGIFRAGRPAIYGSAEMPGSVAAYAQEIGAVLLRAGRDFTHVAEERQWQFRGRHGNRYGLPYPALRGACQLDNASACLAALDELREALPVSNQDVKRGLTTVDLPGRMQVLAGQPVVVLDVAHNVQAAQSLADSLDRMGRYRRTLAVFGMLRDKDIAGVVDAMRGCVDRWFFSGLAVARGADAARIAAELGRPGCAADAVGFASPQAAWSAACAEAGQNDRIVVFGSFYTVAAVLQQREMEQSGSAG